MHNQSTLSVLALALALALGAAPGQALSDNSHWDSGMEDPDLSYDRARRANERGEILSLAEIFTRATVKFPGRIVEAELELEHGGWVYELVILDAGGRVRKVHLDAHSGEVLDTVDREDDD